MSVVLVLIAVVAVAAVLGLRAAAGRSRAEFAGAVVPARERLSAAAIKLTGVEQASAAYPPGDPPPYGALAAELHRRLAPAGPAAADLARWSRRLFRQVPQAPARRGPGALWPALRAWWGWWQLGREFRPFCDAVLLFESQVGQAAQLLDDLYRVPVSVAERCAGVREAAARIDAVGRELRGAGLGGGVLDGVLDAAARATAGLGALPDCFARPDNMLRGASKEGTIAAWDLLEEIEAPIRQHLEQLALWQAQNHELGRRRADLRPALDRARQALAGLPAAVDAGRLGADLERMEADVRGWEMAGGLDVEALSGLVAGAGALLERANGLAQQVTTIQQQVERLAAAIPRAAELLDGIRVRMQAAAGAADCPIDWGPYEQTLDQLCQSHAGVGPALARRTPGRLSTHLNILEQLVVAAQALGQHVDRVREQRQRLVAALARPELAAAPDWPALARDLAARAARYAAGNWPAADRVPDLVADAVRLAQRRRLLASSHVPVPAADVEYRLAEAGALLAEIERFQQRLLRIAERLMSLRRTEEAIRQEIEPVQRGLSAAVEAMGSGQLSLPASLARHHRHLAGLAREGTALIEADAGDGALLDEQARAGAEWIAACRDRLRAVLPPLTADVNRRREAVRRQLKQLAGVAPLDGEQAVLDARDLIDVEREPPAASDLGEAAAETRAVVLLAAEVQALAGERERAHRVQAALRARVADRLKRPGRTLTTARQAAREACDELVAHAAAVQAGWPPLRCDTTEIEGLLRGAERDEKRMRTSGATVAEVAGLMSRLTRSYRAAANRAAGRRAEIDQARSSLQEYVDRLARWQNQLQAYREAYAANPAAVQAVESRLSSIAADLDAVRRQWRTPPSYTEARDTLRTIWSRAYQDVPLRGSHDAIRVRDIEAAGR